MKIIGIIIGAVIGVAAAYKFKLEGDDTPPMKIGLWNAHKHLTKTGCNILYVAYAIMLLSVILLPL